MDFESPPSDIPMASHVSKLASDSHRIIMDGKTTGPRGPFLDVQYDYHTNDGSLMQIKLK
jgi:hypothetical protein